MESLFTVVAILITTAMVIVFLKDFWATQGGAVTKTAEESATKGKTLFLNIPWKALAMLGVITIFLGGIFLSLRAFVGVRNAVEWIFIGTGICCLIYFVTRISQKRVRKSRSRQHKHL